MSTGRVITIVQPTINLVPFSNAAAEQRLRRTAAYARVSTDDKEQLTSYKAQIKYYTQYIKEREDWEFVGMFADRDRTGTTTKGRDGFNKMIRKALNGEIDLIITKSVSRFARNTVDTLVTVRQLKEKGVEVYFEKENIYTLDAKGELLITIMSSLAQEESRSISENVTWGHRRNFADGKIYLPYKRFLGYEKGENDLPVIVEEEAEIVRLIYKLFLQGRPYTAIKRYLEEQEVLSPSGKDRWYVSTIISMLTNEKYMGDAILQKKYTVDFLTHKQKKNEGEVPQYYVENSHEPIVSKEVFALAQAEFKKRDAMECQPSGVGPLSGKVFCADCGGYYGSKKKHSGKKWERTVWRCNHKYTGRTTCSTPTLEPGDIKQGFILAFNRLAENQTQMREDYEIILLHLTDTAAIDTEAADMQNEADITLGLIKQAIEENAATPQNQAEYQRRYEGLAERFEKAKDRLAHLGKEKTNRLARRHQIECFMSELEQHGGLLTTWDEELWFNTVDLVQVSPGGGMEFGFRDGTCIITSIEEVRCA